MDEVGATIGGKLAIPEMGASAGLPEAPVATGLAEHNAQGPYVRGVCRGIGPGKFGGVIEGGTAARRVYLHSGCGVRQTKVSQKKGDLIGSVDIVIHDVLRLDVPVNDLF